MVDLIGRLGLADNTIAVLWGDHGFHPGDLGIWTRHTNYEQANHIPILIVFPKITQPGSSTRQLAETVDIFPTLAELAGLPSPDGPQPIDGVRLVPVLKNPDARVRDHAFHAYCTLGDWPLFYPTPLKCHVLSACRAQGADIPLIQLHNGKSWKD